MRELALDCEYALSTLVTRGSVETRETKSPLAASSSKAGLDIDAGSPSEAVADSVDIVADRDWASVACFDAHAVQDRYSAPRRHSHRSWEQRTVQRR
jgi:hypothetical protein